MTNITNNPVRSRCKIDNDSKDSKSCYFWFEPMRHIWLYLARDDCAIQIVLNADPGCFHFELWRWCLAGVEEGESPMTNPVEPS